MDLIIGLLTLLLVLISILLILLVLVQLPKKEAGLGMAFGASTTEALFGAGSGTVLTRVTKYGTGAFLILALLLSILRNHQARATTRVIRQEIENRAVAAPAMRGASGTGAVSVPSIQAPAVLTNLPTPAPAAATGAPAVPKPAP